MLLLSRAATFRTPQLLLLLLLCFVVFIVSVTGRAKGVRRHMDRTGQDTRESWGEDRTGQRSRVGALALRRRFLDLSCCYCCHVFIVLLVVLVVVVLLLSQGVSRHMDTGQDTR